MAGVTVTRAPDPSCNMGEVKKSPMYSSGGRTMVKIEGNCKDIIDKAEWVAVATTGVDGPQLSATWGDYVRTLGIRDGEIVLVPIAGYHGTEQNLAKDSRIEMLWATRQVQGKYGPGNGCKIRGTGEIQTSGEFAEAAKEKFPWARAVLVVKVEEASEQL